ncbi:MAG TPA: type VI secretion system tip protein TssI/VgrG [Pyrinomonadaceae bacterium]|jgi:type VI secretion system secreted protein VgrG
MAITQGNRVLRLGTPLGEDFLLIQSFRAKEGLSQLFQLEMDVVHEETESGDELTAIDPNNILGKNCTLAVRTRGEDTERFFNGVCIRFAQGKRDDRFSHYRMLVVPEVWLLTQVAQSRVFQNISVPDLLKKVLEGINVSFEIQGTFHPRNYIVQYRESDFAFASRLMEEEGIYYYFEHQDGSHKMIIANTPQSHVDCPSKADIPYFLVTQPKDDFVSSIELWRVEHQLQSGEFTLWDHHFELPHRNLEAKQKSRFNIGGNQELEFYDFPGGYAKRFDGVDKMGGERPDDVPKVFEDNIRTVGLRQQEADAKVQTITGVSDCCSITAGHRFRLFNHPNGDQNAQYVLTSVTHEGHQSPAYATGGDLARAYANSFICIPFKTPYRPPRRTEKPIVRGSQTATVVGPPGEEIFTDKYGRIKVHFHWDRLTTPSPDSSCWVRVGRDIAGKKWGTMFIPRVGQEVIVDFIEGDPDQPIVTGSVYNAEQMPHYELPKFKTLSYIKTQTSPHDGKGFNELRFEDKAGKEQVFVRSQKRMDVRARGSYYKTVGGNRHEIIGVRADNEPGGNLTVTVGGNHDFHIKDSQYIGVDGKLNEYVKGDVVEDYQSNLQTVVKAKAELNAKEITLEAFTKITLKVGGNFITIDQSGVTIVGLMVKINSGGAAVPTAPAVIDEPLDAEPADTGEPGYLDKPRTGGGKGRKRRTLNGQHAPDVTKLDKLLKDAKQLKADGKDAESAAKKQEAIDEAVKVYNIDTSKTKSITYDPAVDGEGETTEDGHVKIGDDAFRDPAWLGSTVGHESEIHAKEQGAKGKWYTGPEGTAIQEVQAYDYEIANAERYGTSPADVAEAKRRRQEHYDALSDEYKQRVDGNPPNYDMKPGDENK